MGADGPTLQGVPPGQHDGAVRGGNSGQDNPVVPAYSP